MPIKLVIKGPITPERVAEVFAEVAEDYARLGQKFAGAFNATIFTTAYGVDGLELPGIYKDGRHQDAKLFPLVPGSPSTPPVSEVGIKALHEQQKLAKEEARKRVELKAAVVARQVAARKAAAEQDRVHAVNFRILVAELRQHERVFATLMAKFGHDLIKDLNEGVAEVWQSTNRIPLNGANKGKRSPPPVFSRDGDRFFISTSPGSTTKIQTPIVKLVPRSFDTAAHLKPLWQYPEWTDVALPRIVATLNKFHQRAIAGA